MASRRIDTKFKVQVSTRAYDSPFPVVSSGLLSSSYNSTTAYVNATGQPGARFAAVGPNSWYFLSGNSAAAQNGLGLGSTYNVAWDDPTWSRVPLTIMWIKNKLVKNAMSGGHPIGYTSRGDSTDELNYRMMLSTFHELEVKNEGSVNISFKVRERDGVIYDSGGGFVLGVKETNRSVGPKSTIKLELYRPFNLFFDVDGAGGDQDYIVQRQDGRQRRILHDGTMTLTLTSSDGIVNTPLENGLYVEDDGPIIVDNTYEVIEGSKPLYADITEVGVDPYPPIFATDQGGKPLYEAIIKKKPRPGVPKTLDGFALVKIEWYEGAKDLDCMGYWNGYGEKKVGWSYGNGNKSEPYCVMWSGDNTGYGPEYIRIGCTQATRTTGAVRSLNRYTYNLHLNFYGEVGYNGGAKITVTYDGVTKIKEMSPSQSKGQAATSYSNSVSISFSSTGTLLSVI